VGIFDFPEEETAPNTESKQWGGLLGFDDNLMFGYFFKDIVTLLLVKCGYEVYPYGYESFFPNLKSRLYDSQPYEAASRIRYTPDLLVTDSSGERADLVEVKARSVYGNRLIEINEVELYLKYWAESLIILVIPSGNYFYAQYVHKLKPKGTKRMYSLGDFFLLEEIFPSTKELPEDFRRKVIRKVRTLFLNRNYANL
jgi:hypothetical protein